MTDLEIPLRAIPAQSFRIRLNGLYYGMLIYWDTAPEGGFVLDISDGFGNPLVQGIPLVTGSDLLAQYAYLNFGFKLFIFSAGAPWQPPTQQNLGVTSHLVAEW